MAWRLLERREEKIEGMQGRQAYNVLARLVCTTKFQAARSRERNPSESEDGYSNARAFMEQDKPHGEVGSLQQEEKCQKMVGVSLLKTPSKCNMDSFVCQ